MSLGYRFAYNEVTGLTEVNGEPITDMVAATIRTQMRDRGFKSMESVSDAYTTEAGRNRYNPIRLCLDGLNWDGQDHIGKLVSFIKEEPIKLQDGTAQHLLPLYLRKWLIGAVARVYAQVGFAMPQSPMLVLDGGQGIGKSTFTRWLGDPFLAYVIESHIDPNNKDHLAYLHSKFIWEVTELGSTTRKADQDALKGFLSLQQVTVRHPYARYSTTHPALACFIGTINNEVGFLADPTGNRRFLCVKLTHIDHRYAEEVDINQVWAQAKALFDAGDKWTLDDAEIGVRDEANGNYEVPDPYLEAISRCFEVVTENARNFPLTGMEILRDLRIYAGLQARDDKAALMALGRALLKLGVSKDRIFRNGLRVHVYLGLRSIVPNLDP